MNRHRRGRLSRQRIIPIGYRTAAGFLRTCRPDLAVPGAHRFSLGLTQPGGGLVGVAMVSRPAERRWDDGRTAEVTVVCTEAPAGAGVALRTAARRIARAVGYQRMITFVGVGEPTTGLRAAGWQPVTASSVRSGTDPGTGRPRPRIGVTLYAVRTLWWVGTAEHGRRRGLPRDLSTPDPPGQPGTQP